MSLIKIYVCERCHNKFKITELVKSTHDSYDIFTVYHVS